MHRDPQPSPPSRRTVIAALAGAALTAPALAQDFSKVEITTQKLSESLYMLMGAGGNIGLSIGPDAVFVIDDQYAPMVPKIKAAIAKLTPRPVQWVLNTHFHFDHTGGNEAFGGDGALIVAHHNVRRRMSADQLISFAGQANTQKATPKAGLPVVTVAGEISFHINGDEVHAFHVPRAHTDGDLIVHFKAGNVVHMGDVFFNGMYPFIDGGSGGTAEGCIAAYERVLALADDNTKIIPGHGPLASKADLLAMRNMVAAVTLRIKALRAAGRNDADIRAAKPAAEFDARFGGGFIKPDVFVQQMLDVSAK
jgi:cyclase